MWNMWNDSSRNSTVVALVTGIFLTGQAIAICALLRSHYQSVNNLENVKKELEKQVNLRAVERAGRISVQQGKRQVSKKVIEEIGYTYKQIGTIESPFPDRRGTPRQPSLVPAANGRIRFDKRIIQHEHFKELGQFSHVWVVFVFHNNTNTEKTSFAAKIKPPRLHGARVGCLSTRSPHRPNNIGLSVCEVIGVGEDFIELRCVDMVHGTPVLDVKPYIPYDVVPSEYVLPMATAADGTALPARLLQVPEWVVEADIPMLPVHIPQQVQHAIAQCVERKNRSKTASCTNAQQAMELISQVLRQDIRGIHQGRGKVQHNTDSTAESEYRCTLDGLEIAFTTQPGEITVQSVTLASVAVADRE